MPMPSAHHLVPMRGRDPHEQGRVASSLELLYDLTFVVAIGQAGSQFAHLASLGQWSLALFGYAVAMFAVVWAWINFAWFASAYDTDDWLYRLLTMVQMVGVVVLALGIEPFFTSLHNDHGHHIDNRMMVLGYVVMRIGLGLHWVRAYVQCPPTRRGVRMYLGTIVLAQTGWTVLAFAHTTLRTFAVAGVVLFVIELAGPYLAEHAGRVDGRPMMTPWHPHHIAERYGLLIIITLGEGVVGTVGALSGYVQHGWTTEAWLVVVAGVGLTFALWWLYFCVEWGEALHAHPERGFGWGYGSMVMVVGVAATGAGLHLAGYVIEGHAEHLSPEQAVLAVVVPVALFVLGLFTVYSVLLRTIDAFHILLMALTVVLLVAAVVASRLGVSMGWSLLIAVLAPVVGIVGFETVGHRHQGAALEAARAD